MTTIVVDENLVMASDTQSTSGNHRFKGHTQKVFHVGGYTIGVAGRYAEALAFIDCFEDMIERQRVQQDTFIEIPSPVFDEMDGFNALVIDPDNNVMLFEGSRYSSPTEAPAAIGSGAEYAYGALAMGATAEQAVEAAMQYDVNTGGEIRSIDHKNTSQEPKQISKEDIEALSTKEEVIAYLFPAENTDESSA